MQARDGVIWAGGHLDLQGPWSQVSGMADSERELGSHVVEEKGTATHSSILAWSIAIDRRQKSLAGYSPCGHKALDTAQRTTAEH